MEITNQELLELSTKIEREGKAFYIELAEKVSDPEVKDFLIFMSNEEALHEKQFKKMLADKGDQTFGWEDNEKLREMIDAYYQTDIFPPLSSLLEQLPRFEGIKKAFEFAKESEKVSREFYGLLQEACTDIEVKTFLVLLEKAEVEHLERIESIRERFIK